MRVALFVVLALCVSCGAFASDESEFTELIAKAEGERVGALTVFVDVAWGARKDRAAKQLSAAHRTFALQGWSPVDVESYIENGDLQGFFVTYRKD